jgi:hypothetical protein
VERNIHSHIRLYCMHRDSFTFASPQGGTEAVARSVNVCRFEYFTTGLHAFNKTGTESRSRSHLPACLMYFCDEELGHSI